MKRAIILIIACVYCCTGCSIFAEEEESGLFLVLTHAIKPGMVEQHNEAIREIVEIGKKHNFAFSHRSYISNSFKWYALFPMDSMEDIDKIHSEMGRMGSESGDEWVRIGEKESESLESYWMGVYVYRTDLSFIPESRRVAAEEARFYLWDFIYIKIGSEEIVNDITKQYVELCRKKGVKDGFSISVSVIDRDMPIYVMSQYAENAADFYTQSKINHELLGEEGKALWEKLTPHIRKIETQHLRYMPELSMPKN